MFCHQCGEALSNEAKFCHKCGIQLDSNIDFLNAASPISSKQDNDLIQEQMYAAFIGPEKSSYYLPIFKRFDQGESVTSWNWAAAFITQLWMLYRGMFLWGFLGYPILHQIFSILIFMASMALFSEQASILIGAAISLTISFIVMGLFSNKILHLHICKMIEKSSRLGLTAEQRRDWLVRKGSNNFVFVLVIIMMCVALLGILAAVAVPAYQDYTTRSRIASSLIIADGIKENYQDFVKQHQQWPNKLSDLGINENSSSHGENISSVNFAEGSRAIRITLKGGNIDGKTIIFIPEIENHKIVWTCKAETLPKKYAPQSCRD